MNSSQEVYKALQDGRISFSEAKASLAKLRKSNTPIPKSTSATYTELDDQSNELLLIPNWKKISPHFESPKLSGKYLFVNATESQKSAILKGRSVSYSEIQTEPGNTNEYMMDQTMMQMTIEHIIWFASLPHQYPSKNSCVAGLFKLIKHLLNGSYGKKRLTITIITFQGQSVFKDDDTNPEHASIQGVTGAMVKEVPNWKIKLIDLSTPEQLDQFDLLGFPHGTGSNVNAYREGCWYKPCLSYLKYPQNVKSSFRKGGLYIIIGGAGGIGEAISEYLVREYQASLIWIGRSIKDAKISKKIDRIRTFGKAPLYFSADAGDITSMQNVYKKIKKTYKDIHGVIHAAIVLKDQSLALMSEEQFCEVMHAKTDVCLTIGKIFLKERLDFILFLSSIQSFLTSAGQSNYAAACLFKDAYAKELSKIVHYPVKVINWGYWGSIGIVASQEYRAKMSALGVGSIEPAEGMKVLELLLAGPVDQLSFLKAKKDTLKNILDDNDQFEVLSSVSSIDAMKININIENRSQQIDLIKTEFITQQENMTKYLCELLIAEFYDTGVLSIGNNSLSKLIQYFSLNEKYQKWLHECFSILSKHGLLKYDTDTGNIYIDHIVDKKELILAREKDRLSWIENRNLISQLKLAEVMINNVKKILCSEIPPTDIMFPNSSLELVEGIYKNNIIADYYNNISADVVETYVELCKNINPGRKIKIFEVGAGTGGASAAVLKRLQKFTGFIDEYYYTDKSRAFLAHGKESFGAANPYLSYKIFDVEQSFLDQKLIGKFDLVLAANVIHATKDIRNTLTVVKSLLCKNGILLMNEISDKTAFTHFTFGLLDGWWMYRDNDIRIPGCPGLYPAQWKKVLESEGFTASTILGSEFNLGQQVICAQSNGLIKRHSGIISQKNELI